MADGGVDRLRHARGRAVAPLFRPLALADELDMTEGAALIVAIALLHIPAALAAAGLSACLPKAWSDVRALAGRAGK